MLFVGHQRLSVLPAKAKVITAAVLAPLDWGLIGCHGHPSSATQHTTETGNIQGKWAEFRESYHLEPLLACTAPKILDKYDWLKQHQGLYVYERLEADHPSSI